MRVLITGSSGLVGSVVQSHLESRGAEVVPFDLTERLDILDRESLRTAARGCDAIVHAAALVEADPEVSGLQRRVNVEGTANVLAAAESEGVNRIVYLSSLSVLGVFKGQRVPDYLPLDLEHPCYASTPYEVSKLDAERLCSEFAASGSGQVVTLRIPGVWTRQTYDEIREAREKDPTFEYQPYWEYGAFLDVRDLAEVCSMAVAIELEGAVTLHLTSPDITTSGRTSREWVEVIHPGLEWRGDSSYDSDPYRSLVGIEEVTRCFDWVPRYTWRAYLESAGGSVAN